MSEKLPFWIAALDSNRFRSFAYTSNIWMVYSEIMNANKLIGKKWKPPKLSLFSDIEHVGREEKLPTGDFMNGLVYMSISEKAKDILDDHIKNQVELLPLETEIGKYYELNIRQIECLDEKKSILKRFPSGKGIMYVEKYAFIMETITGKNMFFSEELGFTKLFVSNTFKQIVEDNKLSGIKFSPIPVPE
jgi:hypothetical protein